VVSIESILTFLFYFVFLMTVGVYFYRKTANVEDYLLGGRRMGSWVTALSAQASDMSGWLLMGLPGAIYLGGVQKSWIAIGLLIGTFVNWSLVAARLRVYTQKTDSLTLSTFFEERFKDPTGLLRIISSVITIIFFTIYSSSGLVASGKLFESMFKLEYHLAVIIGAVVIVLYTFLGGFLAVCWTDLFQGTLMFMAIIIVPILAYQYVGGGLAVENVMSAKGLSLNLFYGEGKTLSVVAIISAMAWGLGYFGQPHILARFMSIKSIRALPKSMTIAMIWVVISLAGAVAVGLISIPMFPELAKGDHEKVFIFMIGKLFTPWVGGVLLAAILSAIMSTIDSQLLVSSSTLTEDFYQKIIKKDVDEKELMIVGRICVLIISFIALLLALDPENTVLDLVAYAWGGFGAAFGPLILAALFSKKTTWQSALAGMIAGTVVLIAWKTLGLGVYLYEIVPGFAVNFITIFLMNVFYKQDNKEIMAEFEDVLEMVKNN